MKYEKPKCDCGAELFYYDEEIYQVIKNITKNGKIKRKGSFIFEGSFCSYGACLECPNCKSKYDIDEDTKGRIIRGEKWK